MIFKGEISHLVEVTLGELQEALSAKKLCLGPWDSMEKSYLDDEFHVHLGVTIAKLAFVTPTCSNS